MDPALFSLVMLAAATKDPTTNNNVGRVPVGWLQDGLFPAIWGGLAYSYLHLTQVLDAKIDEPTNFHPRFIVFGLVAHFLLYWLDSVNITEITDVNQTMAISGVVLESQ